MDTIRGIPALEDTDAAALMGVYSRELRDYLLDGVPFRMATGTHNMGTVTSSAVSTITLPAGRFTQPPVVMAVISNGNSGTSGAVVRSDQWTTTSARLIVSNVVGTINGLLVGWIAVQMFPTGNGMG